MRNYKYNSVPCSNCSKEHFCGNGDSCDELDSYYKERIVYFMDRNQIFKTAFEVIKESTEWGIDEDSKIYGHWIDGVVTVVDSLIEKIDKQNSKVELLKNLANNNINKME
jgi:hypothetical protein